MADRSRKAIRERHGVDQIVRGPLLAMAAQNGIHVTTLKRVLENAGVVPQKVGKYRLVTQAEVDGALAVWTEG